MLEEAPQLAANLRAYINGFSPNMLEVIEKFDFENTITKLEQANLLFRVMERFADRSKIDLSQEASVKQLCEDFAQYLYLPRIKNDEILLDAIKDGVSLLGWKEDGFAYADSYDADRNRYVGLKGGQHTSVLRDAQCILVKSEVADRQLAAQRAEQVANLGGGSSSVTDGGDGLESGTAGGTEVVEQDTKPRRFYGSVPLDATRLGRDAGKIAEEVLSHLTGLTGAKADITLENRCERTVIDSIPRIFTNSPPTSKTKPDTHDGVTFAEFCSTPPSIISSILNSRCSITKLRSEVSILTNLGR